MKASDIHEMRLIAEWQDLAKYYVDQNGIVWSWSKCAGGITNCGPEKEFREIFYTKYRGNLLD